MQAGLYKILKYGFKTDGYKYLRVTKVYDDERMDFYVIGGQSFTHGSVGEDGYRLVSMKAYIDLCVKENTEY